MLDLLRYDFMQQALIAALLVGTTAPMVGVFLVQRRLSLIGDGMGHVALAGVAVGALTGTQPVLTALVLVIICAIVVEFIRVRGNTSGDVALAIMFYGGIALGVVLMAKAPSGGTSLNAYLFGAITTTSSGDLWTFAVLAAVVVTLTWLLRPYFFAVANDEEYSRAAGLPVMALNITLAILTAVTVVLSMRIVGLLLISALMIVPNATGQLLARSFRSGVAIAVLIGVLCSVGGVVGSFYLDTPSGGTIVVLTVIVYAVVAIVSALLARIRARLHDTHHVGAHEHDHGPGCGHPAVPHGDHVDYLHDGHLHAPHGDHYDEHHSEGHPSPPGKSR
ncbi:zinc transport system permease protein [Austwickia chelonae]|uniref:Putative metal ABC transporter permease protein n=1 Tax=Austwickia chelonae NBRC 105200 TaxID=1184607 RepID=K6W518_9MICO|nr:metal ABC transporter permease [Austwickia chelonae]GAB76927.1 putative metal ABC transporter permease protein [Austwickia chelonae NBRC 105200]SEW32447.1 zinc transport system permease protein [Austwickia chelonae]